MPTLKSYLKPVLARKHADLKLSDAAATDADGRISRLVEVVAEDAAAYAAIAKRKTIAVRDATAALKMSTLKHVDPAFVETVLETATTAVEAYRATQTKGDGASKGTNKSRSVRSGLSFPVARIEAAVRRVAGPERRLGDGTGVFVTAVAEMAAGDLLDAAGELARAEGRKTVSPAHVAKAADDVAVAWKLALPAVGDAGQTAGDA